MNKTEQDLIELGKKVAHNYRLIVSLAAFFLWLFRILPESAKQQSGNQQPERTYFKIRGSGNRKRKKL